MHKQRRRTRDRDILYSCAKNKNNQRLPIPGSPRSHLPHPHFLSTLNQVWKNCNRTDRAHWVGYFPTASLVFIAMFSAHGDSGWGAHRSMGRWQWRMTLCSISKATPLPARLLWCCRNHPRCEEGGGDLNRINVEMLCCLALSQSMAFCWALLHLVVTSAVTFTVPLGLLITHSHHHLCLQMDTRNVAIFTEVLFAKWESAFPILPSALLGKLAQPLKKMGQWHKPMISQVLTTVAGANLTGLLYFAVQEDLLVNSQTPECWKKRIQLQNAPSSPSHQCEGSPYHAPI